MVVTPFDQVAPVIVETSPPGGRATDPLVAVWLGCVGSYWSRKPAVALLDSVPVPVPTRSTTRLPLTKPGTNDSPAKFMFPFGLAGVPSPGVPPTNASVLKLPELKPWSTPVPDVPAGAPF